MIKKQRIKKSKSNNDISDIGSGNPVNIIDYTFSFGDSFLITTNYSYTEELEVLGIVKEWSTWIRRIFRNGLRKTIK